MAAGLGEAASLIAVVQITAQIATICGGYMSEVKLAKEDIERIRSRISTLHEVTKKLQIVINDAEANALLLSRSVMQSIVKCQSDLEALQKKLDPGKKQKVMTRFGFRALKWPFSSKEMERTVNMLEGYSHTFSMALQIDHISVSLGLGLKLDHAEQDRLLATLPYAKGAAFNSYERQHEATCLTNTRVDLLQSVMKWADGASDKSIFWLNGMAGTGKSTIARTVAQTVNNQHRLAASFFFSRGSGDLGHAGKFFSTIAFQLAGTSLWMRKYICEAIAERPYLAQQAALFEQCEKLVMRPLRRLREQGAPSRMVLVVVDALDECGSSEDVSLILRLLADAKDLSTLHLRIFLTSRPETPIRLGFRAMSQIMYEDLVLHSVSRSIVRHDIHLFLKHELEQIRDKRHLPMDWPGEPRITEIVDKADCLFIFAATACRFIDGPASISPEKRLVQLFLGHTVNRLSTHNLDRMYLTILQSSINGEYSEDERVEVANQFQQVVGSIVVLFDELSISDLGTLIFGPSKESTSVVFETINPLHSVLVVPEDFTNPVRLLHPSFRDFLLDKHRCSDQQFWVDEKMIHYSLAERCLRVMAHHLQRNLCRLPSPGFFASDIDINTIARHIPPYLQYACRYWFEHAQRSGYSLSDNGKIHEFLREHLLHWLEALSISGQSLEALSIIVKLESLLIAQGESKLFNFVQDVKRFILSYRSIMEKAPLQIYSSAILFSPTNSAVREFFSKWIPHWVTILSHMEEGWGACLQALEGHSGSVNTVVFSPDGEVVASGSSDNTVRLWDTKTGKARGTLEGHSGSVTTVVFSPDGEVIASGSWDNTVRLWDIKTGEARGTLKGHSSSVTTVVFSPDGQVMASGSNDKTVRLWDTKTGEARSTLKGHSSSVYSVVFSPDGEVVASGSSDNTVRLWDTKTGEARSTLEGHSGSVTTVVFSPDGQLVASGSMDKTVRLWDTKTGEARGTLEGHSDSIYTVVFSPGGEVIASGSWDKTVRLWDTKTGEAHSTLKGHSNSVYIVVFSPDGEVIASGSWDNTVRLWDTKTGEARGTLKGHSGSVITVVFSPDGQVVASGSMDKTVRLWDTKTGEARGTLEGHSDSVYTVVFSPDGQLVASGSMDKTVRLWDATTMLEIFLCNSGNYGQLQFSSNGKHLYIGEEQIDISFGSEDRQQKTVLSTSTYYLDESKCWIMSGTNRVLWLPPECRPGVFAIQDNTVVLGNGSGRITFLKFTQSNDISS